MNQTLRFISVVFWLQIRHCLNINRLQLPETIKSMSENLVELFLSMKAVIQYYIYFSVLLYIIRCCSKSIHTNFWGALYSYLFTTLIFRAVWDVMYSNLVLSIFQSQENKSNLCWTRFSVRVMTRFHVNLFRLNFLWGMINIFFYVICVVPLTRSSFMSYIPSSSLQIFENHVVSCQFP